MTPVTIPVSRFEWLARTIFQPSQMKDNKLLKNCLWPRYRKQSRDFPGFHEFRVSVQRLCHSRWSGCLTYARNFQQPNQTLKGFLIATGNIPSSFGFDLEADASEKNPFHCHIVIPDIKLPFNEDCGPANEVLASGLKRRLDNMTDEFKYVSVDDILANRMDIPIAHDIFL